MWAMTKAQLDLLLFDGMQDQIQDQDYDERNVDLNPHPPSPVDDHDAILALQDQQFQVLQDLDQHRCIGNC